ncbi:MAG: ATP-binding protein [Eubacterium sp.]
MDKARSRETGGNGLGLAITRSAILLHRGSIKVHSSIEKQGTTF